MTSAISQSSAGTIIEDLVSNRSIPLKVCMIVLNCAQLISCWIAVGYFIKTYEVWSTLELALSIILLVAGNYLIPGVANGIIYCRRWKHSSVANRKQMSEENKQAWVFLRIALSLLGLPTVGRYIETIIVSNKLNRLERHMVSDSVASHKEGNQMNPIGTSRIGGSTVNQLKANNGPRTGSMISGMSHASSTNAIPETSQKKVRKARRQYKRSEHDGALMALISGSVGAGPMAIGLGFLYFQRDELRAMKTDQVAVVFTSFSLNILWLAACLSHFYPARHVVSEAEFERGVSSPGVGALVLLLSSHVVQVTLRVLCFSVFTNWFTYYVLIPIIFHWLLGTFLLVGYRAYMRSRSVGRPLGERVRSAVDSFLSALFFGYVGIFDFINGNEGKTRLRYLIFYTFYYIENIAMLVIWILRTPMSQIRFPIPFVCCVLALFWLGFILFQVYLFKYSHSPYGTSVIGLCKKKRPSQRQDHYAEVAREPVFGVPVAHSAVPRWRMDTQGDQGTESALSGRPGKARGPGASRVRREEPSSVLSGSVGPGGETPSIYSQQSSSQAAFVPPGRQKQPRSTKAAPPVLHMKEKAKAAGGSKPYQKLGHGANEARSSSSSSSSSSNDAEEGGMQVFNAKPIQAARSQPDLTSMSSAAVPAVQRPVRPEKDLPAPPAYEERPPTTKQRHPDSNSRSLDNLATMVPAAAPNKTTKRIGGPAPQTGAKAAMRPLPSQDQVKSLHSKRDPRSTGSRDQERGRRH